MKTQHILYFNMKITFFTKNSQMSTLIASNQRYLNNAVTVVELQGRYFTEFRIIDHRNLLASTFKVLTNLFGQPTKQACQKRIERFTRRQLQATLQFLSNLSLVKVVQSQKVISIWSHPLKNVPNHCSSTFCFWLVR